MFSSCNRVVAEEEEQDDSYFFHAIKAQKDGNEKEAEELFEKGSALCATSLLSRRCFEKLAETAPAEKRDEACNALIEKYDDDRAKLCAVKIWSKNNDFDKVAEIAKNLSYKTSPNELSYLCLTSLIKTGDKIVHEKVREWFSTRKYTSEHQKFFQEYKALSKLYSTKSKDDEDGSIFDENIAIMEFRNEIYRLSYGGALLCLEKDEVKAEFFPDGLSDEMISDIGKACLYGRKNSYQTIPILQKYIKDESQSSYYLHLYTGRIFERTGKGNTAAAEEYKKAMDFSFSEKTFDDALWYYLRAILATSSQNALIEAEKYCEKWHDAEEFEGFFDTLAIRLVTGKNWKGIYRAYEKMSEYMSDESASQFAYISARLIDTKRLSLSDIRDVWTIIDSQASKVPWDVLEVSDKAYRRALYSGMRPYYSVAAARQLDDDNVLFSDVFYRHKNTRAFQRDIDAETLLLGYIKFDLADEMYNEWLNLRDGISLEVATKLAQAYQESGSDSDNRYSKALRMISYAVARDWTAPDRKAAEQLFPRNFQPMIAESCAKYGVGEPLFLGLVRSESYFDPTISSAVGAAGLSQLMESTASDVARKLKMQSFDLNDAATNITLGTYYIAELTKRLDDSKILALFAYNGGISHVRSWLKSARLEYGEDLPNDLFLEALPFSETREYGRKVVGAAAIYSYLYYGKSISSAFADIME